MLFAMHHWLWFLCNFLLLRKIGLFLEASDLVKLEICHRVWWEVTHHILSTWHFCSRLLLPSFGTFVFSCFTSATFFLLSKLWWFSPGYSGFHQIFLYFHDNKLGFFYFQTWCPHFSLCSCLVMFNNYVFNYWTRLEFLLRSNNCLRNFLSSKAWYFD